ncbi:hypothetical protein [Hymenobacter qilianensis]|uniref:Uncharacterized protein n=1 Tax=Hymenobacter qilianensis TaxID=1385715 RepID=A0A7H0H111_9BACT|nr:hypothetical protein [Hymenobacter qilianensis]QNP54227.1 hypothetical protein H9L05_21345 [Hymenobacter qilianensis]
MAPYRVKNGTIYVKNGTLLREKRHPCVKNGTISVKNGTRNPAPPQLREKWHPVSSPSSSA